MEELLKNEEALSGLLNNRQLSVMKLRYLENKTIIEIAKLHNVSKQFISQTIKCCTRKLEKLKKENEPVNLDDHIKRLKLSNRAFNSLEKAGVIRVADLIELNDNQLRSLKGMGILSVKDIDNRLTANGFKRNSGTIIQKDIERILRKYKITFDKFLEELKNVKALQE